MQKQDLKEKIKEDKRNVSWVETQEVRPAATWGLTARMSSGDLPAQRVQNHIPEALPLTPLLLSLSHPVNGDLSFQQRGHQTSTLSLS